MPRIHGLDLARALAIIGMMVAHIGPENPVTDGYPSVLFAVLSGVSMGIITAGSSSIRDARFRLLVRAVLLLGIGLLLAAVQSGILIVLTAIGAAYLLLLPVLRWRTRSLFILLAGLVLLGPLVIAAQAVLWIPWADMGFADLFFGAYPLTAWTAYVLVGLLIHRLALHRQVWLLGVGLGLFALTQFIVEAADFRVSTYDELNFFGAWAQPTPHSGGLLDVLSSAAMSAAVIAACLLACRVGAVVWATYPVRAFGAMSLTVYVVHVLITTIANGTFLSIGEVGYGQLGLPSGAADFGWTMYEPLTPGADLAEPDPLWPSLFLWQLAGFLLFAALWRWRFRRGPIEWAMHRVVEQTVSESVARG